MAPRSPPHAHAHPHAHPHPHPSPQSQAQQMQVNPPDPAVQAAIDAQFRPVKLKLGVDDGKSIAVCAPHGREVCEDCKLDFFAMNQTARVLQSLPSEMRVPPPPNIVHPQRTPLVQKAKEEGNVSIGVRMCPELHTDTYFPLATIQTQST